MTAVRSAVVYRCLRESPAQDLPLEARIVNALRAFTPEIRSAASHEASHALAAILLGGRVREARLIGRAGHGETDWAEGLSTREEVSVLIAGHIGAQLLWEEQRSNPDPDLARANPMLWSLYGSRWLDELDDMVADVSALLAGERRSLYYMAVALAQRGRITGQEVRAIAKANGARLAA